ncbi:hypothetical protein ACFCYC_41255 [Streptomyces sp. NPDC056402]|uniref:hypothetical protein n=1 Tax=Streptomyces sp. NPDC056402 TaxID=3345810 RepID=UPI0035D99842
MIFYVLRARKDREEALTKYRLIVADIKRVSGREPTSEEFRRAVALSAARSDLVRARGHLRRVRRRPQVTQQRLNLALLFLPPDQRERYRLEWGAEMATLEPQEAAAFALHILKHAPMAGIALVLKRVFGRRPA